MTAAILAIKERPTPTIENYLAKILEMERKGEEVIGLRLAQSLNVAASTVSVTLRRMERDGWIKTDTEKGIRLTKNGREAASSILRRHMLAEWMLKHMLDIPWSGVHEEADNIEHTISAQVEAKLIKSLNNPKFCPHGNPLPGNETIASKWIPLTATSKGLKIAIRQIDESAENNKDLLVFLEKNGILPYKGRGY